MPPEAVPQQRQPVAIVGAGLIGRAWAIVFASAGHPVRLHDTDARTLEENQAYISARLEDLASFGLLRESPAAVLGRISSEARLVDAVENVVLVQENVRESVEAKRAIFAQLDELAPADAILASSTSWLPASTFTGTLAGRARCLVGHPANPPYLIPLVEVCPAPWTASATVERALAIYTAAGQVPVTVRREVEGFLLNRVQAAVLNECFNLFAQDLASAADIDKVLKEGLALRWSFMGPFETIDLNAPGGLADYARRYGTQYRDIAANARPFGWDEATLQRLEDERRQQLSSNDIGSRSAWRDRRLMALAAHKRLAPDA